jgi:F-type H+-transporting ATPase subunit delta
MPTQTDSLAKVYARSLFELAAGSSRREAVLETADELEQIGELMRGDKALREMFASPIIDPARREASLRKVFSGRVSDLTLRFLLVLNDKGRLSHLGAIIAAFDQLVQEAFGKVEVDVFTAAPLGAEQLRDVAARIQAALRREPVLHPYTEPSMIGGIKLRIGDQLVDGSVAAQLRRLRSELLQGGATIARAGLGRFIEERNP